jgi:hypothetical protein
VSQPSIGNFSGAWQNAVQPDTCCRPKLISITNITNTTVNVTYYNLTDSCTFAVNQTASSVWNYNLSAPDVWVDNMRNFTFNYDPISTQMLIGSLGSNCSAGYVFFTNGSNSATPYQSAMNGSWTGQISTGCCIPDYISVVSTINATNFTLSYFFGDSVLINDHCLSNQSPSNVAVTSYASIANFSATTTNYTDSLYSYTYQINANSNIVQVYYNNSNCSFELTNYTAPSGFPNASFGSTNVSFINTQCCQPSNIHFANYTNLTTGVMYSFIPSQLNYCNSVASPSMGNMAMSTLVYSTGPTGQKIWQDDTFSFAFYEPTSGSSIVSGVFTNTNGIQCDFEVSQAAFNYNISGVFGNPSNIMTNYVNGSNVTEGTCCLPVSASISGISNTSNYQVQYNFGAGQSYNPACNPNMTTNVTNITVSPSLYNNTLTWSDKNHGYYYSVNATDNYSFSVIYKPTQNTTDSCSYTLSNFTAPTALAVNGTMNASSSAANAECCSPSTITFGTPNLYNVSVNYTFSVGQISVCSRVANVTFDYATTLEYSLSPTGNPMWQDVNLPFQYQIQANGNGANGYNPVQNCNFTIGDVPKSAVKLSISFVFLLLALLMLN